MKPGTLIERAAKPIARALNLPCLDEQGRLRPESNCAKRRNAINDFSDSMFDIFWEKLSTNNQTEK